MYYVHVNRNTINSNTKNGTSEPAVRFQKGKYGKAVYANRVRFKEGELLYSPHKPLLPCGARMVIATPHKPEIIS
jgi:hypothetical protein